MNEIIELGRLEEVDIRNLWIHEQYDFSSWLAQEENIELINNIIGMTLTEINKEVYTGSYRCDLVAIDETTANKVIIENQLEATNHDHLGKIITYASGLDADVIVWIVKDAREEHKRAIEWLNNNMTEDISFFLLEIHAYRIGNSLPAPKFEVIEQPNIFVNSTKSSKKEELNKTLANRLEFWTEFNEVVTEKGTPFNTRKPSTDHWYDVAIGTSDAHICITLVNKDNRIGVELYIPNNKYLFDELIFNKDEIESKLGFPMRWDRLDKNKASRIIYYMPDFSFDNKDNHEELMSKIIEKVIVMRDVFKEYM